MFQGINLGHYGEDVAARVVEDMESDDECEHFEQRPDQAAVYTPYGKMCLPCHARCPIPDRRCDYCGQVGLTQKYHATSGQDAVVGSICRGCLRGIIGDKPADRVTGR